ncbi:fimbrial protein [Pseudomonas denitrificans (nom. rej.)]|nr:fimbrial protein [Pseudomonas denitrificans (nom. rej.)]
MKSIPTCITALLISIFSGVTYANSCYWIDNNKFEHRDFIESLPSTIDLARVPIGGVMASAKIGKPLYGKRFYCPHNKVPEVLLVYTASGLTLSDGFSDVFQSGAPGIGIRLKIDSGWPEGQIIPFEYKLRNGEAIGLEVDSIKMDFIRTALYVEGKTVNLNFDVDLNTNGNWHTATMKFGGAINLVNRQYFAGCSGADLINVNLGTLSLASIDSGPTKNFHLNVLCTGLPAGTNLPVKVYFEGNSDGPGRLNIAPGGAEGVEIALSSAQGKKLPFNKSDALNLTWINSDPAGERYDLEVDARYARKPGEVAKPGKADAVLNYILEYN